MIEETIRIKIEADGADKVDKALGTLDALEQKAKELNVIPEGLKVPDFAKKIAAESEGIRKLMATAAKLGEGVPNEKQLAGLTKSNAKALKLSEALRRATPGAPPRMSAPLPPGTDWERFHETGEMVTGPQHVGYESPTFKDEKWTWVKGEEKEKKPPAASTALGTYTGPYEGIPGKMPGSPLAKSRFPAGLGSALLAFAGTAAVGSAINKYVPGLKGSASKYFGKGETGKQLGELALGTVPGGAYAMIRTLIDKFNTPKPFIGPRPAENMPRVPEPLELPVTPDYKLTYPREPEEKPPKPLTFNQWEKLFAGKFNRPQAKPLKTPLEKLSYPRPNEAKLAAAAETTRSLSRPDTIDRIRSIRRAAEPATTAPAIKAPPGTFRTPQLQPGPTEQLPSIPRPVPGPQASNTYHINIHQIAERIETKNFDEKALMALLGRIVKTELRT